MGVSTVDVCLRHPDKFSVVGLCAGRNLDVVEKQARALKPKLVSVTNESDAKKLQEQLGNTFTVMHGDVGACAVASQTEADLVVSAIVGAAGLKPTLAAVQKGINIALANKESMVIAGEIMATEARKNGVTILPVDSEHSAIFQSLQGSCLEDVDRLILTASGGPFLHKPAEEFKTITREQALKHPNWDMGAKITIDSATMMNKGLEVMEARWLFDMPVEKIGVVVHPQSIIHSMVEFCDGSVMAQMGEPDMRVPIAYALSYPRRVQTGVKKMDLPKRRELTFYEPDLEKFRCLKLAFEVAKKGGSFAPVLNAANEIAVAAFLAGKTTFTRIAELVENCLESHVPHALTSIDDVLNADAWARKQVENNL